MTLAEGCYEPAGTDDTWEALRPTHYAATAWGPNMQHGGPVAGLLARAMQRHEPVDGTRISRISVDILGPVPMSQVRVAARLDRPGRRIALLSCEMQARLPGGSWRPVARAHAWRLATHPTPEVAHHGDPALPAPADELLGVNEFPAAWRIGFVNAVGCHFTAPIGVPGAPTIAWLHLTQPLVAGETTSDLVQVMSIADTANGVGSRLDIMAWTFLNADVTVHLFEEPRRTLVRPCGGDLRRPRRDRDERGRHPRHRWTDRPDRADRAGRAPPTAVDRRTDPAADELPGCDETLRCRSTLPPGVSARWPRGQSRRRLKEPRAASRVKCPA